MAPIKARTGHLRLWLLDRARHTPLHRPVQKAAMAPILLDVWRIKRSGMFDEAWYLEAYPDVRTHGVEPILHYLRHGAEERRDPGPSFDTSWYLQRYPDVAAAGMNALVHYVRFGRKEGRIARGQGGRTTPDANDRFGPQQSFDVVRESSMLALLDSSGAYRRAEAGAPLVSVIMPTRDRAVEVRGAVRSVLAQSWPHWELFVVDDGSRDGTAEMLRDEFDDPRIHVLTTSGVGAAGARNLGLERASGDLVAYLDSDNRWRPDLLRNMVAAFDLLGTPSVYCGVELQGRARTYYRGTDFDRSRLLSTNYIDLNAYMHRRDLYLRFGGFEPSLRRMVDWDLILRYTRESNAGYAPFLGVMYDDSERPDRITNAEPASYHLAVLNRHIIDWKELELNQGLRDPGLVSIVVPIFNEMHVTSDCVASLFTNESGRRFELVLLDNGSDRETQIRLQQWRSLLPGIKVVRNNSNLNFALGCNTGFAASTGATVVFLNNDTTVTRGWLDRLVSGLETEGVGAAAPKMLYPDGTVQFAGLAFSDRSKVPYHMYRHAPADLPAVDQPRELQAVTGACLAIRAADFIALRGFDPVYANGCEDLDLCFRLRLDLHKSVRYVPDSVVVHYEGKTPGRGKHLLQNRRIFVSRWGEQVVADDRRFYEEDGLAVIDYVKPGAEPDGETAAYEPRFEPPIATTTAAPRDRTLDVGFVSIWHVRGVSFLTSQLARALESSGFRTHVFARWESDRFENAEAIRHPRVHDAGDDPPPEHLVEWARHNGIDLVVFMEVHPKDWKRVEALKRAGIRVMCLENLDVMYRESLPDYGMFDQALCITFHAHNVFAREFPQMPILTVPWGIDPPARVEAGGGAHDGPIRFVHVAGWGGLNGRKNTGLVIKAFARSAVEAELRLYSQAPFGAEERQLIGADPRIVVVEGTVSDIFEAYQGGDVLLFPSKREGLGLPIVEALSVGMPVIVSDGYLMKEWIQPEVHGLLVRGKPVVGDRFLPELDVDEDHFVALLERMASDLDEVARMSAAVVRDRHRWIWDWQPSVLREQLRAMILDEAYGPPRDLGYVPSQVREFERRRALSDGSVLDADGLRQPGPRPSDEASYEMSGVRH